MEDPNYIPIPPSPAPPVLGAQASQDRPSAPSLMELLRKRVERNIANEPMQRLADLGAGMLANPDPNFFRMLGGGLRAQSEGERSRMQELRQIADSERQAAQQQAEEAYRREQNAINERRWAAEAPLRAAQTRYYDRRATEPTEPRAPAGAITPARLAQLQADAGHQALNENRPPSGSGGILETAVQRTERENRTRARAQEILRERLAAIQQFTEGGIPGVTAPPPPPSAPLPAAQIDARGNPLR